MSKKNVFHVARECSDIIAAGGVGDVVLQLALKCVQENYKTTIILPNYAPLYETKKELGKIEELKFGKIPMEYSKGDQRYEEINFWRIKNFKSMNFDLCLVNADRFSTKHHPYVYTEKEIEEFNKLDKSKKYFCGTERPPKEFKVSKGVGHYDFFAMNTLLQKATLKYIEFVKPEGYVLIHGHDAHTATLPFIAKEGKELNFHFDEQLYTFVITAHNCESGARQQTSDSHYVASILGIPEDTVNECRIDDTFDPFGAAALYSNKLNTVSEGYAWEIEQGGFSDWISGCDEDLKGLSEFLKKHDKQIIGITNGIDPSLKGPENLFMKNILKTTENKSTIRTNFDWKNEFKKSFVSKRILDPEGNWNVENKQLNGNLKRFNNANLLFTFVGRLVRQKAPDIFLRAIEEVFSFHENVGLCILGDSEQKRMQEKLENLSEQYEGRVIIFRGFSPLLADEIYAAGDFFLIPSRFEPCGLIDYIAQLNGNIPIANQVGGLSKIINGYTGIGYFGLNDRENLRGLVDSMHQAIEIFKDKNRLNTMRETANSYVRNQCTWDQVFSKYEKLYNS